MEQHSSTGPLKMILTVASFPTDGSRLVPPVSDGTCEDFQP